MNDLLVIAAHNTIVTLVLSLVAFGLTRVWRSPPFAHFLWLIVLLKLVAPPLWPVDGSAVWRPNWLQDPIVADTRHLEGKEPAHRPPVADRPTAPTTAAIVREHALADGTWFSWNRIPTLLLWFWFGGAAFSLLLAVTRIARFEHLLRDTLPASEGLQRAALKIAVRLGVRRMPDLRYVECVDVPLLWCAGRRPTIVLPMRLAAQLDDERLALILAHELAHLRRGDHCVRAVELLVSAIYWWNPLVGCICRQIHQAEDQCCDAWVRWAFPDSAKRYAEILLKTAESLGTSQAGVRLLPASPFLRSPSLKARIEMILESRFAPQLSTKSMLAMVLVALLVLPLFVETTSTQVMAGSKDDAPATPAARSETSTTNVQEAPSQETEEEHLSQTSEFPYAVKFEQGATRFLEGDKITILEVRGTAETFSPGNIYWIKGKYALKSHDRAAVAAYTTAMEAENGRSTSLKVQSTVVDQGDGTFTLFLPMAYRGWPHVSFYPAEGGQDFGGNYFGTGDCVLKRWWGEKE